ncbi:hypothetical protein GQR58_020921 [Nymphon striatum]|nr:hypothetical protein GQR58_020921 [Nymphon striatum]
MGKTVPGTRSYHHYTPISTTEISYKRTSEHEFEQHFNLSKAVQVINDDAPLPNLNDFVACRYDTFWWVGIVDEIEAEKKDFKIKFMHPHGPSKRFSWPERDDSCWVPINNMIAVIGVPTTRSGRIYEIDIDDFNKVVALPGIRLLTMSKAMLKDISLVGKNSEKDVSCIPEDAKVIPLQINGVTCNLNVPSADYAEICIRLLNFAKKNKDISVSPTKPPSKIAQASPERYGLKKCSLLGDISETSIPTKEIENSVERKEEENIKSCNFNDRNDFTKNNNLEYKNTSSISLEHNVDRLDEKIPIIDKKFTSNQIVSSSLFVKKSSHNRLSLKDKKTNPQKRKHDDIHRNFDGIKSATKVAKRSFTENGEVSRHEGANTAKNQPDSSLTEIVPNQRNDLPDDCQKTGRIIPRIQPDLKCSTHIVPNEKDVKLHQTNVKIIQENLHNIIPEEDLFKPVAKTVSGFSSRKDSNHKNIKLYNKSKTNKKIETDKKKKLKSKHNDPREHSSEEKNRPDKILIKQSIDKPELLNIGNEREGNVMESVTASTKESRQTESGVKLVQRKIRTDKKTSNFKPRFPHNKITIDNKNSDRKGVKNKLYVDERICANPKHASKKNPDNFLDEIAEKVVNDTEYSNPKKTKRCGSNPHSTTEEVVMTVAVALSKLNSKDDSFTTEKLQTPIMPINNEVESQMLEMEMDEYLKKLSARCDKSVKSIPIHDNENEEINQVNNCMMKLSTRHDKSSYVPDKNEVVPADAIKESAKLSDRYLLSSSQSLEISNANSSESTLPDLNVCYNPSTVPKRRIAHCGTFEKTHNDNLRTNITSGRNLTALGKNLDEDVIKSPVHSKIKPKHVWKKNLCLERSVCLETKKINKKPTSCTDSSEDSDKNLDVNSNQISTVKLKNSFKKGKFNIKQKQRNLSTTENKTVTKKHLSSSANRHHSILKSKIGLKTYVSEKNIIPKNKKGLDSNTTSLSDSSDDDLPAVNFNEDSDKATTFKEDKTHLEISQASHEVVEENSSAEIKDKPTNLMKFNVDPNQTTKFKEIETYSENWHDVAEETCSVEIKDNLTNVGTSERNIIMKDTNNNNIDISGKDGRNDILKNCGSKPDETASMSCNSATTNSRLDCESTESTTMIKNETDDTTDINVIEVNNQNLDKHEIECITLDEEDSTGSITTEEKRSIEMKNDNIDAFKEHGAELIAYRVCGDSIEKLEVPCEKENAVCENLKKLKSEFSHEMKSTEVDVADECITNEYFKSQDKVLGEEIIARNEKLENINVQKMVRTDDAKNLEAGIDNGLNSPEILNVKIERSEKISCTAVVEKSTSSTIGRENKIYKGDELQNCSETVLSENETDQQNATSSQKRYNPKIIWLSENFFDLMCNNATLSEIQNDVEDIISIEKLTLDKVDVYDIFSKLIDRLPNRNNILDQFSFGNTKASDSIVCNKVPHNTTDNAVNVNDNGKVDASVQNKYVCEEMKSITNSSSPDFYKSFKMKTEKSDNIIHNNTSQTSPTIDENPGNSDPAVSISVFPKVANSQLEYLLSNFPVDSSQHTVCTSINSEVQRSSPNSKDSDSFVTQLHDSIPFEHNQNNSTILHKSCNLSADLPNSGAQFNKNDGNVPKDNMNNLNTQGSDPSEKLTQLKNYVNTLNALILFIDDANKKINYVIENTMNNKNGHQIYTDLQETSASHNNQTCNVLPNNGSSQQIIQKFLTIRNKALYIQKILIHNKEVVFDKEESVESVNSGMSLSKPQLLKIVQTLQKKIPSTYFDNSKHVLIHNVPNPHISEKESHANFVGDNAKYNQKKDTSVQAQQPPKLNANSNEVKTLPSDQRNSYYDKYKQPYPPDKGVWNSSTENPSNFGGYHEVVQSKQIYVQPQQAHSSNCNNQQLPNIPSNGYHDKRSQPYPLNQPIRNFNKEKTNKVGGYPVEALQGLQNYVQAHHSIVNSDNKLLPSDSRNGYYNKYSLPITTSQSVVNSNKEKTSNAGGCPEALQSQQSYVPVQQAQRPIVNSNNPQLQSDYRNGYRTSLIQPFSHNQASPALNSGTVNISSNQFRNQTTQIVPQQFYNQLSTQNVNTSTVHHFSDNRNISNTQSNPSLQNNNLNINSTFGVNTTPNSPAIIQPYQNVGYNLNMNGNVGVNTTPNYPASIQPYQNVGWQTGPNSINTQCNYLYPNQTYVGLSQPTAQQTVTGQNFQQPNSFQNNNHITVNYMNGISSGVHNQMQNSYSYQNTTPQSELQNSYNTNINVGPNVTHGNLNHNQQQKLFFCDNEVDPLFYPQHMCYVHYEFSSKVRIPSTDGAIREGVAGVKETGVTFISFGFFPSLEMGL